MLLSFKAETHPVWRYFVIPLPVLCVLSFVRLAHSCNRLAHLTVMVFCFQAQRAKVTDATSYAAVNLVYVRAQHCPVGGKAGDGHCTTGEFEERDIGYGTWYGNVEQCTFRCGYDQRPILDQCKFYAFTSRLGYSLIYPFPSSPYQTASWFGELGN